MCPLGILSSRGRPRGLRHHASSKTYSVVDDIRNQFIIGTEKIVIFVIRKLILNFSVGFSIFKTNMVFTPTKILRSNSQDPRPVLIFVFIKMIASHVNETGPFENFSYNGGFICPYPGNIFQSVTASTKKHYWKTIIFHVSYCLSVAFH